MTGTVGRLLTALLLAVAGSSVGPAVSAGSTADAAVSAPPSPNCGGDPPEGAVYVADSGFAVTVNADTPPPGDGPFLGAATVRFGNATLRADGEASVHVVDAEGPTTCFVDVTASPGTPIRISVEGVPPVVVESDVETLAIAPTTFEPDAGRADLAYASSGPVTLTIPETGLPPGTAVEAVDTGSNDVLATGTTTDGGGLSVSLPPASAAVNLVRADPTAGTGEPATTAAIPGQPGLGITSAVIGLIVVVLIGVWRR